MTRREEIARVFADLAEAPETADTATWYDIGLMAADAILALPAPVAPQGEWVMVPTKITPEIGHALESNFAECLPPSEVHAANWQEAWTKALASVAPQAPAGWVVVPRKPTDEMLRSGGDQIQGYHRETMNANARFVWNAMLAASPPPVADAVRAEREACAREADYYAKHSLTAKNIAKAIRARSEP